MLPSQKNVINLPSQQEDKGRLPSWYSLQQGGLLFFVIFVNLIGISLVTNEAEEFFMRFRIICNSFVYCVLMLLVGFSTVHLQLSY